MDLIIKSYGTRIRARGERIIVAEPGYKRNYKVKKEIAAKSIDKIVILRPSSISTDAVKLAIKHEVDIVYLNYFGDTVGRIFPSEPKGTAALRKAQALFVSSPAKALELARTLVLGKGANQVSYLRQLEGEHNVSFKDELLQCKTMLESLIMPLDSQVQRDRLFGTEGIIAERYFSCLRKLHPFPGRKPRGRDKFNSAFNYGYGILYNEVERACHFVGLDPFMGTFHAERSGKPSLVLDLVEEYRVPVVDSMIFPLFLKSAMDKADNFVSAGPAGAYRLSDEGKRVIVEAVYNRLNQEVEWDGKKRTVKAVIYHQAQSLGQHFTGKRDRYIPFSLSVTKNG